MLFFSYKKKFCFILPSRHVVFPRCNSGPTYWNRGNLESFAWANLSKSLSRTIVLNIGNTSSKKARASAPKNIWKFKKQKFQIKNPQPKIKNYKLKMLKKIKKQNAKLNCTWSMELWTNTADELWIIETIEPCIEIGDER